MSDKEKELKAKVKILESLNDKNKKEIDRLKAENDKLEKELAKLKEAKSKTKSPKELQKQIEKLEAQNYELKLQLADVKGLQTMAKDERDEITESFDKQAARIKELQAIINEKDEQISELSGGLDAQKMQAYDDFVLKLQTELNQVKQQLARSEQLRTEQQTSIERFEAILAQVQEHLEQQEATAAAEATQAARAAQQAYEAQAAQAAQANQQLNYSTTLPEIAQLAAGAPQPRSPTTMSASLGTTGTEAEVIKLLDSIAQRARSGIPAQQLGNEMEQIRNKIVEIFQWHPALFELAAFSRRLKAASADTQVDANTLNNLLSQIENWKKRILD
jgi:chromosome segregation ATPase